MRRAATNVQGVVIANCGHFVAEEQPEVLIQHLSFEVYSSFRVSRPYRRGTAVLCPYDNL